jgi:hypothetical protein
MRQAVRVAGDGVLDIPVVGVQQPGESGGWARWIAGDSEPHPEVPPSGELAEHRGRAGAVASHGGAVCRVLS